jgi:hypothetical protein
MLVLKFLDEKPLLFLAKRPLRTWSVVRKAAQVAVKTVREVAPAAPAKPAAKGIPYKNLTIGIPKEIYPNEKRYNVPMN